MQRRKFFKRILATSLLVSPVVSALANADQSSPVNLPLDNGCTEPAGWQETPSLHFKGRTCPDFNQHITGWVVEFKQSENEQPLRLIHNSSE